MTRVSLSVNGTAHVVEDEPLRPLAVVLRETLRLTGTKIGCEVGVCGLCSVLVDGDLVSACLTPVGLLDGATVMTIEGIAPDGALSPVQDAFVRCGGFQCGICTPGQIVAATALLEETPRPDSDTVREWMAGNLCRCTGYYRIVDAVLEAAGTRPGDEAALSTQVVDG